MLPLYTEAKGTLLSPGSHTGLWYDKFCHVWDESCRKVDKQVWIATVAGTRGDPAMIKELAARQARLIKRHGQTPVLVKTASRFVTGLGRAHPVENGFVWHPTLGTPFLPGSSVKGMVRAWARLIDADRHDINRIFGPEAHESLSVGSVIFLDGLPRMPVKLEAEVMTPHYGPWYQKGETPGDWFSPTPIPFLVTAADQAFQFGVLPRRAEHPDDEHDAMMARQWLLEALDELGAGAKTANGYGRFVVDQQAQAKLEAEAKVEREKWELEQIVAQQTADLSPLAAEFKREVLANSWESDKNSFVQQGVIESWLERFVQTPDTQAIEEMQRLVRKHFPGLLENPEKVEGKKQKPAFGDRQKQIAYRLRELSTRN